jgi:hypothetical protein
MAVQKDLPLEQARATARRTAQKTLTTLRKRGTLSEIAADMLQAELDIGAAPDVYWDAHDGRWWVFSEFDDRRYSLPGWEAFCASIVRRDGRNDPVKRAQREQRQERRGKPERKPERRSWLGRKR